MKFEETEVWGFKHAFRGMRNPKNSHHLSDSRFDLYCEDCNQQDIDISMCGRCQLKKEHGWFIGNRDLKLAQDLIRAGAEHRKFMRQIFVSVDITAPIYWWKEFDTYKVGTVANSTSTMHKLTSNPITIECFEIDDYQPDFSLDDDGVHKLIDKLENLRGCYLSYIAKSKFDKLSDAEKKHCRAQAKFYWKELVRWLPESWLQTRTVTMNYENLLGMCSKGQRRFHKLNEWSGIENDSLENFISWARELPYAKELIFIDEVE